MTRSSRAAALPLRILIVASAALIPALAGCEAGNNAPTLEWHQPTAGDGTQLDGIAIRNLFILGAPLNSTLAQGASAGLFVGLVNNGSPDRLISITAPGVAKRVVLPGGSVELPTRDPVMLTGPTPEIILTDLNKPLPSGSSVKLTLTFQNAGSIKLNVPVLAQAEYYSTFSPPPTPTPSSSAGQKGHKHSPSPTPSASGTG